MTGFQLVLRLVNWYCRYNFKILFEIKDTLPAAGGIFTYQLLLNFQIDPAKECFIEKYWVLTVRRIYHITGRYSPGIPYKFGPFF